MNVNAFLQKDYENEPHSGPKKQTQNKANSNPIKACPELAEALSAAEGAVEKFLSLWPESDTIIRKSVIRQFKRGRPGWRFLGTVTKRILEHSPVGSDLNLEIGYHVNAIFFRKDRF